MDTTDPEYTPLLLTLIERVNGFVYPGDRANAVMDTITELRKDPELAQKLLKEQTK